MTKEKQESLKKYLEKLQMQLASPIPQKHEHAPSQYKAFLEHEIFLVKRKLDDVIVGK